MREEEKKKTITSKIVPTLDIWVGSGRGGLNPLWPGKESVAKGGRRKDGAKRNGSIMFKKKKRKEKKNACRVKREGRSSCKFFRIEYENNIVKFKLRLFL